MVLRDDDLLMGLAAEEPLPEGSFAPHGRWSVHLGNAPTERQARMVTHHEMTHALLNRTTTWGGVLFAFGLIARAPKVDSCGHARRQRDRMVDATRTTHEVCATACGAWSVGDSADELIAPYPEYVPLLAEARALMPRLREGGLAKFAAVYLFARASMQSLALSRLLETDWRRFSIDDLADEELPDVRFAMLRDALQGNGWERLLREWRREFAAERARFDVPIVEATENLSREAQVWLYERYARQLRRLGAPTMELNAHNALMSQSVAMLERAGITDRIEVTPPELDSRAETRGALRASASERLVLRHGLVPARVPGEHTIGVRLELPGGSAQHLFLVVRPLERLLAQYSLSAGDAGRLVESARGDISVALRSSHLEDGELVVELHPIPRPHHLALLLQEAGDIPMLASVSAAALRVDSWRDSWLDAIRAKTQMSVLIDLVPVGLLDERHDNGTDFEVCAVSAGVARDVPAGLFIATDHLGAHIAVCSLVVAETIAAHACAGGKTRRRSLPADSMSIPLGVTVNHLLTEEPWFDFGAGQGDLAEVRQ